MLAVEIVGAEGIDPQVSDDIEMQLLKTEVDDQSGHRVVVNLGLYMTTIIDENTLQMLGAALDETKQ